MIEANSFAYIALMLVVPGTIVAFWWLGPRRAVFAILLGSILFLPQKIAFDAPLVPPLDKHTLPAACMLIGVFVTARERLRRARVGRGVDLMFVAVFAATVGTVLTNPEDLAFGPLVLPGLIPKDAITLALQIFLGPYVAFLLGRVVCQSGDDARDLLRALTIAALVYSPFVLVELKMSPQWHGWIYGFGQHDFLQTIRGESYRPMCFMENGLALALFISMSGLAAWQLAKANLPLFFGISAKPFAIFLSVLLASLSSTAALLYGIAAYSTSWLLRPKTQLRIAAFTLCFVLAFPVLRIFDLVPTRALVDFSARFSQARAESLGFRFKNEDQLLERSLERPWFGWGGYGRGFIHNNEGRTLSVTDGAWIIIFNISGGIGFALRFGVLAVPIFIALRRIDRLSPEDQPLVAGAGLATAFYTLDQLPNGLFNQLPSFLAGAVLGLSRGMSQERKPQIDPALVARLLVSLAGRLRDRSSLG